jgi:hypothetical protein
MKTIQIDRHFILEAQTHMKKSKEVAAGLTLLVGASLLVGGGCAHKNTTYQTCTDKSGKVVDDKYCEQTTYHSGSGVGGYMAYRWYYSSNHYTPGSSVVGGSYVRPAGKSISVVKASAAKSGTARGMFGRSGRGGGS